MNELQIVPNGGINTYDAILNDNQLSDACNVWWKGVLKQRDGIEKILDSSEQIIDIYPKDGSFAKRKIGGTLKNGIFVLTYTDKVNVKFFDGTTMVNIPFYQQITLTNRKAIIIPSFTTENEQTTIMVIAERIVITKDIDNQGYLVDIGKDDAYGDYKPYIPTVMINSSPYGEGEILESRNLLTGLVKQKFTTRSAITKYKLLHKQYGVGNVNYTDNYGDTREISYSVTAINGEDTVNFYSPLIDASSYNMANNLEITYQTKSDLTVIDILNCTLWSYFGGDRQGLSSGNRIFLSGNPKYPNRIWWSASNNPFYFPEDNFNDIGDSSPILALGKVFDSLIVFKENATYRIKYAFDDENYVAYFPVSEISPSYGCDMPKSIQLINNDLVWCHSKHGVLLLKSTTSSVADERVIRKISRNINSVLLTELKSITGHCSLDYGGYYYLFINGKAFLWDYNTTPYSYQNSDEEQKRLAWYYWELPIIPEFAGMALLNETFTIFLGNSSLYRVSQNTADKVSGTETDISCYLTTKAFDFGHPELMKRLVGLNIYGDASDFAVCYYNNGLVCKKEYGTLIKELLCGIPFKSYQNELQVGLSAKMLGVTDFCLKYEVGKAKI